MVVTNVGRGAMDAAARKTNDAESAFAKLRRRGAKPVEVLGGGVRVR